MNKVKLSIVIHTEEEFDWSGGFNRNNNSISHGKELIAMCTDMLELGCCITFAMDWAFVNSEQGVAVINHMQEHFPNQVEFATHLHPWVNPPFDEQVSDIDNIIEKLSYPGNLPANIERAKLSLLTEKITDVTGTKPTTYLAGRYGVGQNTYQILNELNYKTDVSVSPFADFRHQEGPNFAAKNNNSFMQEGIKCIPHSTGYISYLPRLSDWLNEDANNLHKLNNSIIGKVILRLLGVKRVRLSPEGFSAKEMQSLADSLSRIGVEHLIYSFHSSSSKVGGSPYSIDLCKRDSILQNNMSTLSYLSTKSCFTTVDSN